MSGKIIEGKLNLPMVTLIGVDCVNFPGLVRSCEITRKYCRFCDTKMLTSQETDYRYAVKIPEINSRRAYSEFIIKEIWKYVDSKYMLIIQHDGHVMRPESWEDSFLDFDYVGAPWDYGKYFNVGNGGFSLRTRKLMKCVSGAITQNFHPCDMVICRNWRNDLEREGFRWAPVGLAGRFSIETMRKDNPKKWNGEFGAHHTDWLNLEKWECPI